MARRIIEGVRQRRPLISAIVLVALAATVARGAVTRHGVGLFEFIAAAAIVGDLLTCVFRLSRRAIRRA